jgi:MFS family permease
VTDTTTPQPAPTEAPRRQDGRRTSLWRHRNFRLLFGAQTLSETGNRVSGVAIPLLALTLLHATAFEVALLTALAWLPYVFFALPAGVYVDRVRKRRLMVACDLARMALMASLPVAALLWTVTFTQLYVVVSLCGVLTVFFNVAQRTQLPLLVTGEQLVEGRGKMETAEGAAELAGPAIGGLLVGLVGAARTVFTDALSFLLSAGLVAAIRTDAPEARVDEDDRIPFGAAVREGLAFVLGHPLLRRFLACSAVNNFFVMAITGIEVVFLVRDLHASPFVVGLVFTGGTIGGILTGLWAQQLADRIGSARVIWVAMAAPGPLYLLMPLATPGWGVALYAVGLTAFSANAVLYNSAMGAYMQRICPTPMLGRMNASNMWVSFGVVPLGALFGGALGSWIGLRGALLVGVLGAWSACLPLVLSPLRAMRDVPED